MLPLHYILFSKNNYFLFVANTNVPIIDTNNITPTNIKLKKNWLYISEKIKISVAVYLIAGEIEKFILLNHFWFTQQLAIENNFIITKIFF